MITKNELVLDAFEELRISGLTVTPNPAEVTSAIRRMDSMVLAWQNMGLCLSYVRSAGYSDIDPDQDSGINDTSALAVVTNLAKTIAPRYGKSIHPQTLIDAKSSYEGLFSPELTEREQTPYLPTGAGNSFFFGNRISGYCFNYFQTFDKNAPDYCATKDIFVGQVDYYSVDFNPFLNQIEGDTILSFTIEDGEGVKILDSVEENGFINLKAEGGKVGYSPVLITITTAQDRILPESVNFDVVAV